MSIVYVDDLPMSEATFERLAEEDPARLIALLANPAVRPGFLTYAAETAGRLPWSACGAALTALCHHAHPLVREGAIRGLDDHMGQPGVVEMLEQIEAHDTSPWCRECASGRLDWYARESGSPRRMAASGSAAEPDCG